MIENVVLDLDETLIHSYITPVKCDFKIDLQDNIYYVKKRPGLAKFLVYLFRKFKTVSVWTAATQDYAVQVIANIFTKKQREKLKFFHTRRHTRMGTKPLEMIFNSKEAKRLNINQNNTVIIDDKSEVVYYNPGNGIIVPAWHGNPSDTYLAKLIIVLSGIIRHRMITDSNSIYLELRDITD